MFVLGLTGSIGMGKTTTAKLFAEEGVPVYDADAAVHELYDGEAADLIEAAFPGTVSNGKVDRNKLATKVVGHPGQLKLLESLVHPLVRNAERKFLADAEASGAKVAVLDIPLLYETAGDARCDAVVVVTAAPETQRQRVLEREAMTEERFLNIIARQMPDEEKRRRADFIVDSGNGFDAARAQVREILARVATMPKRRP
jgi:dephospho-CoA kinase